MLLSEKMTLEDQCRKLEQELSVLDSEAGKVPTLEQVIKDQINTKDEGVTDFVKEKLISDWSIQGVLNSRQIPILYLIYKMRSKIIENMQIFSTEFIFSVVENFKSE